jgi:hypothetical protein
LRSRLLPKIWHPKRTRKAVSAVIGGLILFSMIFTVGFGYFYTEAQVQAAYQQQLSAKQSENLLVTATASTSALTITVTNLGIESNVTAYMVINNSTSPQTVQSKNIAGGAFLNPGQSWTSPSISYILGDSYILKVITSRGNVFSTTYPLPTTSLATQALTSGALGDLYLSFNSYQYFNVTTSNCPQGNPYSGYCLTQVSGHGSAFTIPHGVSNIAFAITITDLNSQEDEIVLDQFTLLYQVIQGANAKGTYYPWYIVSNTTTSGHNAILSQYTPIPLKYDSPETLIFASGTCLTNTYSGMNDNSASCGFQPESPSASAGYAATVFILSHGWETSNSTSLSTLSLSNSNYGQNSPYVSTVYF